MKWKFFAAIAAMQLLVACVGPRTTAEDPGITLTDLTTLPAPSDNSSSFVQAGDQISISVLGAEGLTGEFYVNADGSLRFPLIGSIQVAGLTPAQVADELTDRLSGRYVKDPAVTVLPSQLAQPSISVGGEVEKPGNYSSRTSQTLLRAVNNAGGLTEFAEEKDVLILREVDEKRYIGVYNISAIQRGNYPDPEVYPDDVIIVGDSPTSRRIQSIFQLIPLITSSILVFDRLSD